MRWVWIILLISGCALARYTKTADDQPVYVLMQPTCLLGCISNLGTNREQVIGGTGGNDTVSNSGSLGMGAAAKVP